MSPGPRRTSGSSRRASWLPRLVGLAVVVVLAGGGVLAYVVGVRPHIEHRTPPLPTTVISAETVGLVAQTPGSAQLLQLLNPAGKPGFTPLSTAQAEQGSGQWTANQMAGGTYIFIFLPSGQCLTAAGPARRPTLGLAHCVLTAPQRWRRTNSARLSDGHAFYQYASLSDGECLTQPGTQPGGRYLASLSTCSAPADATQLIAFWWATE
ncbi:MAG TPA: RICIN domain-containing protein [Streptosporangiaceae bacterium]